MLLLAHDANKSLVNAEEQIVGKKNDVIKHREIMLPLNEKDKEDEVEPSLRGL